MICRCQRRSRRHSSGLPGTSCFLHARAARGSATEIPRATGRGIEELYALSCEDAYVEVCSQALVTLRLTRARLVRALWAVTADVSVPPRTLHWSCLKVVAARSMML